MMKQITEKFIKLKKNVGGNREQTGFEWTMGKTTEERMGITTPNPVNRRILAELEYLMHLSEERQDAYSELLEKALDYLLDCQKQQGVLKNQACEEAEAMLMPLEAAAKEYDIILAAHAHIDMNWMWSYSETVAITLATFRSILNIMEEYPEFCFSQSQGSVYKIVEEEDPSMMEEIKARIAEGRWEVTASAWVETDKNMPSTESLLRHIEYTKEYMRTVWGAERLEVDFSPDTFGHSRHVPEINAYGDVKYYYHCRGSETKHVLYRYKAPSGKEVLVHREHNWYNSGITPHIGVQTPEISKRSGGLKTILIVYGVGDHGGGPTRRDVERALEMMEWKLFPRIHFGTFHEYFDKAAAIWEELPIINEEMNFIFQGCYTTQNRIKRGNKRSEMLLNAAEHMTAMAGKLTDFPYAKERLTEAWQNVLFTHFHDIITGSCTEDSREYAMGLYQRAIAAANTQIQNAMRSVALNIDTSSIPVEIDAYNSQSEGAGVGFGVENFIGVPSTERGSGRTRIFHVFNVMSYERKGTVELSVWDWTGNMRQVQMKDFTGKELMFQLLDGEQQRYWSHYYFRVLTEVTVPAFGYTTVVLTEKETEQYPVLLNEYSWERVGVQHKNHVLENEQIRVVIDKKNGRIISMFDKALGKEMLAAGKSAGFTYIETETMRMSAWTIGRYLLEEPVEKCVELRKQTNGNLRQSVKATYELGESKIEVIYSLDKDASMIKLDTVIDWHGHSLGKKTIPLLDYRIPLSYETEEYMYDIPAGTVRRKDIYNDVPALQYGMALSKEEKKGVILVSDCKYGYRGEDNALAIKLINSASYPDPYPERGIHKITLWLGVCETQAKKAKELAMDCNQALFYQPSNCHKGKLPMEHSILKVEAEHTVVSAVLPQNDGSTLVRVYEVEGDAEEISISCGYPVKKVTAVNLCGEEEGVARIEGQKVFLKVNPYSLAAVQIVPSEQCK